MCVECCCTTTKKYFIILESHFISYKHFLINIFLINIIFIREAFKINYGSMKQLATKQGHCETSAIFAIINFLKVSLLIIKCFYIENIYVVGQNLDYYTNGTNQMFIVE